MNQPIKQSDGSLLTPFQQAKRYAAELPYSKRPRWIVTCNFAEFYIYDMEKPFGEPEVVYLKDLEKDYYRLQFLVDSGSEHIKKELQVSIAVGEIVGRLYDALLAQYKDAASEHSLKSLNMLCVRLVFCFYAEDAGIFGRRSMFHDYLEQYSAKDMRRALIELFKVLDTKAEERDPYLEEDLAAFPYVNGGLFENENIEIPQFTEEIRQLILTNASEDFDWSAISPTIFGAVFESTLNPETRRSGGMHYTSIENIHKVIDPLFLDALQDEFAQIKELKQAATVEKRLRAFQSKLADLVFLDPACGSGNFLTETYISLRRLENRVLKELLGAQIVLGALENPIQVSISQFYGIEINDFAVTVAKTALWIAESQMMKETEDIVNMNLDFLPLKTNAYITEANALRIDWESVVPKAKLNYIMGNPPFVANAGRVSAKDKHSVSLMSEENKIDREKILGNKAGIIDYVACWHKKASLIMKNTHIHSAFVSTNSIVQGQQVEPLWSPLIRKPICDIPPMLYGSKPTDGGNLILSDDEYNELVKNNPKVLPYMKKLIGAKEFINNSYRWCLWLVGITPNELKSMPQVLKRVKAVRDFRLQSKKLATRKSAEEPALFQEIRIPKDGTKYIAVPEISSGQRKYIPMAFFDSDIIVNNKLQMIADATLYHFGILESNVHMSWVKTVCGYFGPSYDYSSKIVYNNFPWPTPTPAQKERIEKTAQAILDARALYPESSLADLYDELTMPVELRKAHRANDKAVMEAYGFWGKLNSEAACVAELMKLYKALTEK